MWRISERFDDDNHYPRKASINLNPDKDLNPYTIAYPLIWTGYVAGQQVEIIQISNSASFINDFDFKVFPENYNFIKSDIIKHIHICLNTLN
jgi:hypothetical protein